MREWDSKVSSALSTERRDAHSVAKRMSELLNPILSWRMLYAPFPLKKPKTQSQFV